MGMLLNKNVIVIMEEAAKVTNYFEGIWKSKIRKLNMNENSSMVALLRKGKLQYEISLDGKIM